MNLESFVYSINKGIFIASKKKTAGFTLKCLAKLSKGFTKAVVCSFSINTNAELNDVLKHVIPTKCRRGNLYLIQPIQ